MRLVLLLLPVLLLFFQTMANPKPNPKAKPSPKAEAKAQFNRGPCIVTIMGTIGRCPIPYRPIPITVAPYGAYNYPVLVQYPDFPAGNHVGWDLAPRPRIGG